MGRVSWRFYSGIRTIGGTVIGIECDGYRLLFDMGRIFNPGAPFFDAHIPARGIRDLQRVGIAPKIDGLFEGDGTVSSCQTLVAVSHSHLDHIGLLPYLRSTIPILLTEGTFRLIQALDISLDGPRKTLNYQPIAPGIPYPFGPFEITCISVDHDTTGACAFFIKTPELKFVYSGDLRLHGAHPEFTHSFAKAAREFQPDVLFIEGTRAQSSGNAEIFAEKEVVHKVIESIQASQAGAYFTFYPRHPERLSAFQAAAKETDRQLVLDAPSAYIFQKLGGELQTAAVWEDLASPWPSPLEDWVASNRLPIVNTAQIRGHEAMYLIELPYRRLIDWIDIDAKPGGVYIHSNGAPLGPYDPTWNNLMQWLSAFEIKFANAGSTGHGSRSDILSIVETIAPRVLMPIHSLKPELIGLTEVKRLMPAYDKRYTFADLDQAVPPTKEELQSAD